jgi:hypothetical protein
MGQPVEEYATVHAALPCRVNAAKGGERNNERMSQTFGVTHRGFFLAGADVHEDDRVVVTGQGGEVVLPEARVVLRRPVYAGTSAEHHLEADLEALRGPM